MALGATIHRLKIQLADSDRGVYEALDLRLARHPSETPQYCVTRALAYALCFEEGITFSHGLSHADEPALWVKTLDGRLLSWIEIGTPSAERLHKASKGCPRVLVFTHHDPALLQREVRRAPIHRLSQIEAYSLPSAFTDALAGKLDRNIEWELVRSGGQLYVNVGGESFDGALEPVLLTLDA